MKTSKASIQRQQLEREIAKLRISQSACFRVRSPQNELKFNELTQQIWLRLEQLQTIGMSNFGKRR